MKKLFIGSGILLALLVIMAFTGLTNHEDRKKAAFNEGNLQYAAGNYEQAIQLYNEAPEKLDRYLNSGNASFKLGEADQDAQQKLKFYQEAVKTYKLGVLKFPENVALKYNYEYVLKKLESQQQNQQDSDKNDDKKDENQDKQDSQSQDNQKGDGQKDQQGDQSDKQDGQQPSPSGQPDKRDGQQPSPSGEPDKQDGQQSSQAEQGDQSSPSPGGEGSAQSGLSDKELEQVMGMLEKQEQDSLKNNQEIKKEDKGEAYDW